MAGLVAAEPLLAFPERASLRLRVAAAHERIVKAKSGTRSGCGGAPCQPSAPTRARAAPLPSQRRRQRAGAG